MMFSFAMAQEIHWANQATVGWDEVVPLDAEDIITYRLYTQLGSTEIMVDEVSALEYTFTFDTEGIYTVGVQAVRNHTNGDPEQVSIINWSDENGVWTPSPFVFGYYIAPDAPHNFRVQ